MSDLIEKAQAGDAVALEQLLAELAPSVERFGLRMCKNADDADDVLQDTLLAIAEHLPEFEGRSSLRSWAFALTRSACARRRRGLKNKPHVRDDASDVADASASPEDRAAGRELAGALSRALDALPEEQREVILLRDVEDLTAPEAAAAIGISVDAVKSRLHRARSSLRTALAPVLERDAPTASPTCPEIALVWSQKLEGDLSQADCAVMEEHLKSCGACSAACDALRSALASCKTSARADVRPEVHARVKAAVAAWVSMRG